MRATHWKRSPRSSTLDRSFHTWNSLHMPTHLFTQRTRPLSSATSGARRVHPVHPRAHPASPLERPCRPARAPPEARHALVPLGRQQEAACDPAVERRPADAEDLEELLGRHVGGLGSGLSRHGRNSTSAAPRAVSSRRTRGHGPPRRWCRVPARWVGKHTAPPGAPARAS